MLGKVFYIEMSGIGKMPVMHFGMTGMLQVVECDAVRNSSLMDLCLLQIKGQLPTYYRETPKNASADWPPRFMKVRSILYQAVTRPN